MNPLDIGVIAVIGLSAVFAFARGFVREALSIVAWVGAGFVTLYGAGHVYALVEPMVHNPLLSNLIAYGGTFLICLVLLTIITGIVARSVRAGSLSSIDRTLGFIFGVLRGAFVICLAYLLLDMAVPGTDRPSWLREAKSAPYLQQGADMLRNVLPESLRQKTSAASEEIIKTVSPAAEAEKAMRALTNPTPAPQTPPGPASPPTYRQSDQNELGRIIDNNQR
jgi:membrane protein required for colicin V production